MNMQYIPWNIFFALVLPSSSEITLTESIRTKPQSENHVYDNHKMSNDNTIKMRDLCISKSQPSVVEASLGNFHNLLRPTYYRCKLTYLPLVPHICVDESGQHWFG